MVAPLRQAPRLPVADADRRKIQEQRRLKLLKRSGMFGQLPPDVSVTRAVTTNELAEAYELVHDVFVERGYIQPTAGRIRVRTYEALPTLATFVAKAGGRVVGVQSLAADDPDLGLPSDLSFRAEIDQMRAGGALVCEAINQAIAPDYRRTAVPTELMRALYAQGVRDHCDRLVTTISPGHVKFYELLGFRQISETRSYSPDIEDPVVVMLIDMNALLRRMETTVPGDGTFEGWFKEYYVTTSPYPQRVDGWASWAGAVFQDPAALRELFVDRSGLLAHCTQEQREVLRKRWGEEVFTAVCGEPKRGRAATGVHPQPSPQGQRRWRS